jgi:hypothetical protein
MADRPRLTNPVAHVVMADGTDLEVTCTNADLVAYDLSRGARKWPMPNEGPLLYQTFLAWKALTREALIDPKMPWEAFLRDAVEITTRRPDGTADQVDVDPTPPDPGSG